MTDQPTIMITEVEGRRRLAAFGAPFQMKDALKAIPGRLWSPELRVWHYPPTARSAAQVTCVLPRAIQSAEVLELAKEAERQAPRVERDLPPIPDVKTTPWAHQVAAYWFAREHKNVLINYGMGSGKSKVVIDLVGTRELAMKRVLITCPLAVVDHWPADFAKHCGINVWLTSLGRGMSVAKKLQVAKEALTSAGFGTPVVLVINHESLWRKPFGPWALQQHWDLVVCDESHRAKKPGGKFSMYLRALRQRTDRRICTTGTPMPHSPMDLYAQARFIDPVHFGPSHIRHRARYAVMGGFEGKQVVGFQRQPEFSEIMDDFTISVRSEDVLDLPPVQHLSRECVLSAKESKAYREMEANLITDIDGGVVTAANAMARVLRLAQITGGTTRDEDGATVEVGTSKRDLLADTVDGLGIAEPVVVFCRFHADLNAVWAVARASERPYRELSGRRNELKDWQESENPGMLGVQLQAGGVGVDLTRARYCIYYAVSYSLGDYEQSLARLHRPGQEHPVIYYHLIAKNTIDTTIYEALRTKGDVIEAVLGQLQRRAA